MKNLLLVFVSIFLFSCEPSISDEGKKLLNTLRSKYSCYQAKIGSGTMSDLKGEKESINFISITIIDCEGKLHFDSVQTNLEETKKIADKLFLECKNKDDYDGIQITYTKDKKGLRRKEYLFLLDNKTQSLNISNY